MDIEYYYVTLDISDKNKRQKILYTLINRNLHSHILSYLFIFLFIFLFIYLFISYLQLYLGLQQLSIPFSTLSFTVNGLFCGIPNTDEGVKSFDDISLGKPGTTSPGDTRLPVAGRWLMGLQWDTADVHTINLLDIYRDRSPSLPIQTAPLVSFCRVFLPLVEEVKGKEKRLDPYKLQFCLSVFQMLTCQANQTPLLATGILSDSRQKCLELSTPTNPLADFQMSTRLLPPWSPELILETT